MEIILIIIVALILGSFFIVVGLRIPKGESIVHPRSHCINCNATLSVKDLIPVISLLFSKGKCRHCKTSVSFIYPMFELLTAIGFVSMYLKFGFTGEFLIGATLVSLLIIISISDIRYMMIPDKVLLFFISIILIEHILYPLNNWFDLLVGGLVGFVMLLCIAVISRGSMGGGDIKLFGVLGIVLGVEFVLLAFFLSTFFGTLFSVYYYARGTYVRGKKVPFGPFIAMGAYSSFLFGEDVIDWYLLLLFR